jgi:cell division protein FtsA
MSKEQYIVGLDIGTQNIRVVQAKIDAEGQTSVVGASLVPAAGIRKGVIVDIEEAVSSITSALEKVERMTGVPVTRATVSVGGNHIQTLESRGVIAVSRADGEIADADIIRVIDASQAISIPPNREVIHVIPKTFTLDGQTGIKDPLGMTGIRLEVETIIVHGGLPFIKNLNKAITQAGLEIESHVLAPLACSQAILNKRQKDLGVVLLDLGAGTTSVSVYEEGNLLHAAILPVGGMHITNDIAIGLRTSIDTAERVKLLYGAADSRMVDHGELIDLNKVDPEENGTVSRKEVVEIIEARLEEIFDLVNRELKNIDRDGKLPAGVVLTGGGSELQGVLEVAKDALRLPAQMGQTQNIVSIIDRVEEPTFAVSCGLVLWAGRFGGGMSGGSGFGGKVKQFTQHKAIEKLKKTFKSFLP